LEVSVRVHNLLATTDAQRFVRSSYFPDDLQFIRVKMQLMMENSLHTSVRQIQELGMPQN